MSLFEPDSCIYGPLDEGGCDGWVMSAGTTHSSNWSPVTAPDATAASRNDVPSRNASLAMAAALS